MHDLLAPAIGTLLIALALACVASGVALLAVEGARRLIRAIVADALSAAYLAGWRPPIVAMAVDPMPRGDAPLRGIPRDRGDTMRCGPPPSLDEWPDMPEVPRDALTAEVWGDAEDPSGVRCATMLPPPPFQAPLRLPVFQREPRRAEQLTLSEDTPTTPKDPRSP